VRQQEERILLNTKISLKKTQQHRQEYVLLVKRKSTGNYKKIKREIKGEEGGCFNTKPITTKQQKQQQLPKQKIKNKNKNKNIKGRRENFKKGQEKRREEKRKGKERTATYGDP
jgi:GH15 family glucan-1,4-alpha-glucosidase